MFRVKLALVLTDDEDKSFESTLTQEWGGCSYAGMHDLQTAIITTLAPVLLAKGAAEAKASK